MVTRFEREEEGSGCVAFCSGVAGRGAFGPVGGSSVPLLVAIVSEPDLVPGTGWADEMPGESYESLTEEGESMDRLRDGLLREVRLRLGEGRSVSM